MSPILTARAPVAQAQAPGTQLALIAACGSGGVLCVAIGATAVTAFCLHTYQQSGVVCDTGAVEDAIEDFVDWFEAGGAQVQLMTAQYSAHPDYLIPTQETFDEWWTAFGAATASGWVFDNNYASSGVDAFVKTYTTVEGINRIVMPTFIMPSASAAGASTLRSFAQSYRASGTSTHINEAKFYLWDETLNDCVRVSGSCVAHAMAQNNTTAGWYDQSTNIGLAAWQNSQGHAVHVYVDFPTVDTGNNAKTMVVRAIDAYGITLDATTDIQYRWSAAQMQFTGYGVVIPTATGDRYNVPADVEEAIGYTGGAIPRANGSTGPLVVPGEGVGTGTGTLTDEDERPWWEGLFGGVRNGINALTQAVTNTYTAVLALPATIAALFDPSLAWADFVDTRYPETRDAFYAAAPGCYLDAVTGAEFFDGGTGGDVSVVDVGIPPNTIEVTIPVSSEVAAISYPLSTLIVAVMMWAWVFGKVTNPIPVAGSAGSGVDI